MYPLTEHCGILLPAKAICVNSSLCTSWGIRGRKGKPLLITDLSPTWRWVITLAIQPSYPEKRDPGTHWVGLSWYRRFGEEARTSLVPARNLGTIPQQSSQPQASYNADQATPAPQSAGLPIPLLSSQARLESIVCSHARSAFLLCFNTFRRIPLWFCKIINEHFLSNPSH